MILVPLMWDDEASSGGANDKVRDWDKLPLRGWRAIAGVTLVVATTTKRQKDQVPPSSSCLPVSSTVSCWWDSTGASWWRKKVVCRVPTPASQSQESKGRAEKHRFITNIMTRRIGQGTKGGSALKFYGYWENNSEFMSHRLQTRCSILSLKNKVLYIQLNMKLKLVSTAIDRNTRAMGWRTNIEPQILKYLTFPYFLVQKLLISSDLFSSLHIFFLFRQLYFLQFTCVRMDKIVIQPLTASLLNVCTIFPICELGWLIHRNEGSH